MRKKAERMRGWLRRRTKRRGWAMRERKVRRVSEDRCRVVRRVVTKETVRGTRKTGG
jgi:hypothetical protein